MRISDFIEQTNKASTPEEIFGLYERVIADYGYDRLMYSALALPDRSRPQTPAIARNYDDDWIRHYIEAGYVENDPVRLTGIATRGAFTWKQVEERAQFQKRWLRIFPEARAAHLHDGIGIPFHGPGGEVYGVGMASSLGGADPDFHLDHLYILSIQFHTAYSARFLTEDPVTRIKLTPREQEILKWALAGKANWDISAILGISENTVQWHLQHIYDKLDTSSRIVAVVKALNLGLITP